MTIDVNYLNKCIRVLETGIERLQGGDDKELYELHCAGCVKEFKLIF